MLDSKEGPVPFHIVSAYAETTVFDAGKSKMRLTRRERFFERILEDCARLGDLPAVICMDANVVVSSSPTLVAATKMGWTDIG